VVSRPASARSEREQAETPDKITAPATIPRSSAWFGIERFIALSSTVPEDVS
jgi:hypothetical protein